jgi:DinB superfamily
MNTVEKLIQDVAVARRSYINQIEQYSEEQAHWKPGPEIWDMVENTEHLFWAEQGGILGMWKTINAIREGKTERKYEGIHKDMSIEQIINLTWQPKEIVPAVAAPRFGGPLSFWSTSLNTLQDVLDAFGHNLKDDELRLQAHPHPISGPMDFQQRIEFLRFHINRHREQVIRLIDEMN